MAAASFLRFQASKYPAFLFLIFLYLPGRSLQVFLCRFYLHRYLKSCPYPVVAWLTDAEAMCFSILFRKISPPLLDCKHILLRPGQYPFSTTVTIQQFFRLHRIFLRTIKSLRLFCLQISVSAHPVPNHHFPVTICGSVPSLYPETSGLPTGNVCQIKFSVHIIMASSLGLS